MATEHLDRETQMTLSTKLSTREWMHCSVIKHGQFWPLQSMYESILLLVSPARIQRCSFPNQEWAGGSSQIPHEKPDTEVWYLSWAQPVSWKQRYSFKYGCWITNINMQLYDTCIQMNYADQLQEALSLWNRKTSKAIMIKFNQSYSIYINIHTFCFFFSTILNNF